MSTRNGLVFIFLLLLCSFDTHKLGRVKVADGISILLPRDFRPMDELDFSQRYPSVRRPLAAYTDIQREVAFSLNISATQWPDANAEMAQKFFKASIYNTFDRVTMISEGVHDAHGKKLIFFEFESRIKGNPRELGEQEPVLSYSYLVYLVEADRTLVFSFNCPQRLRQEWSETAKKIMTSIKLS
jgi:hypothetical protein